MQGNLLRVDWWVDCAAGERDELAGKSASSLSLATALAFAAFAALLRFRRRFTRILGLTTIFAFSTAWTRGIKRLVGWLQQMGRHDLPSS